VCFNWIQAQAHCGGRMKTARMQDLNYNTFRATLKRLGISNSEEDSPA